MFYAKSFIAKGWTIVKLDSCGIDEYVRLHLRCSRNADSPLNAQWREKEDGWFVIEFYEMCLNWILRETEDGKTRICLYTYNCPDMLMPAWLFKFVAKKGIPGLVRELEEAIERDREKS